jgi:uncharacterized protein (TIGR02145 family)
MKKIYLTITIAVFLLICMNRIEAQTIKDGDGNIYKSVRIGTQVWMNENLKATKLNDGTAIPLVADNKAWEVLTTPAFCWYNNDAAINENKFGALYNWYTVNTNKLCPKGWHVPTDAELTILITYLGGESVAGGKLRETGTTHWEKPNTGATNESGFTAFPGGYRNNHGGFANVGFFGFWWSATERAATASWNFNINCANNNVLHVFSLKKNGYSVRCVQDK